MSLHFLLDAYNIIYSKEFSHATAARKLSCQTSGLSTGSLEEQRQKLIQFVDLKRPQGSLKNSVTIVFDGRAAYFNQHASATAKIVFARKETADEKLLRLVDQEKNRKNMIVVTNDRAVQYAARALGAKVWSVADFIKKGEPKLVKKGGRARKQEPEPLKDITKTTEQEINSELKSVWLKRKPDTDCSD